MNILSHAAGPQIKIWLNFTIKGLLVNNGKHPGERKIMAEELKQLIDVVSDLPGAALWVLFGFALYKLVTYLSVTGSITYIIKLAIQKAHDAYSNPPKPAPKLVSVSDKFITSDGTYDEFLSVIHQLTVERSKNEDYTYTYLHKADVFWLRSAILEKAERERSEQKR